MKNGKDINHGPASESHVYIDEDQDEFTKAFSKLRALAQKAAD